jgi:predicted secreted Zn-dependent protease
MKKLFILCVLSISLLACNSNNKSNTKAGEKVEPYSKTGVQNVNGNIPDTTNAIDLSTKKVDSAANKSDTSLHK